MRNLDIREDSAMRSLNINIFCNSGYTGIYLSLASGISICMAFLLLGSPVTQEDSAINTDRYLSKKVYREAHRSMMGVSCTEIRYSSWLQFAVDDSPRISAIP